MRATGTERAARQPPPREPLRGAHAGGELDFAAVAAAMRGRLVVDGRNFLDPDAVIASGLTYEAIGRPTRNGVHKGRVGDGSGRLVAGVGYLS